MAETTPHKGLTGLDIHTIVRWVVADAASLPTNLTAADLHKVAYTQDTKTYYGLVSASPVEWRALGSSANPVVDLEVAGSDLIVTFEDETTATVALPSGGGGGAAPIEFLPIPELLQLTVNDPSFINNKTVVSEAGLHHVPISPIRPSQLLVMAALAPGEFIPPETPLRIHRVAIQVAAQDGEPSSLASNPYPIPPLEDEVDAWRTEWFDFPLKDLIHLTPDKGEVKAGLLPSLNALPDLVYDEAGDYIELTPVVGDGLVSSPSIGVIIPCGIPSVYIVSARLHIELVGYTVQDLGAQGIKVHPGTSIEGYVLDPWENNIQPFWSNEFIDAYEADPTKPNELVMALLFPQQPKPQV